MEQRTDTGCMLPGKGDNAPLPEVAPDRSTAQSQDLKDRYIAYLEQSLERANEENRQLRELVSRLLQGAKVPVADLPPADNSVTLPPMFVASLRQDECRSCEIIRLVKNVIVPTIACRDRKLYRWYHVRMVMLKCELIDGSTKVSDFARDMAELLLGERGTEQWRLKTEALRKAATYPKHHEPDYTTLDAGDSDKESCLRVEEALTTIIRRG